MHHAMQYNIQCNATCKQEERAPGHQAQRQTLQRQLGSCCVPAGAKGANLPIRTVKIHIFRNERNVKLELNFCFFAAGTSLRY